MRGSSPKDSRVLRLYVDEVYADAHFHELKKDLEKLSVETSEIQSVTIGINVNSRLEATSMGLISVNNKPFKKSNIVSNIADSLSSGDKINDGNEWNGDMHYRQVDANKDGGVLAQLENLAKFQAASSSSNFLIRNQTIASITESDGMAQLDILSG